MVIGEDTDLDASDGADGRHAILWLLLPASATGAPLPLSSDLADHRPERGAAEQVDVEVRHLLVAVGADIGQEPIAAPGHSLLLGDLGDGAEQAGDLLGAGPGIRYAVSNYFSSRLDVGFPLLSVEKSSDKPHLHFNAILSY